MYEFLNPFKQSPSQKFHRNLNNFEYPKDFQKPQKLGKKCMKCMIRWWKEDHTCEKCKIKTKEGVGKRFEESERCLGRWEVRNDRERVRKWRRNRTDPLYRNFIILDRLRCVERYRALKRSILVVEELSRIYWKVSAVKEAQWIEEGVEMLSSKQKVS